jgi:TRAP-type C4-dicarboxylate transport system substrate-binding protein
MQRTMRLALIVGAFCLAAGNAGGQVIKLGTLAPAGSPWEEGLRKLAFEWSALSRGRVTLKVFAGGIVGDEDDMLRKMRIGQLGAAALSGPGLSTIAPGVFSLQVPLLVSNDAELDYLMEKMTPRLSRQFEDNGFKLLAWTRAGWAYLFARRPVAGPDDLRAQKMWIWQGRPDEAKAWRELGFQPVTLATADVMIQLETGGVDAFITSPLVAASNQYFAVASNMTDLRLAPFIGGLVVSARAWDSIPAEMRPRLEEAALEMTRRYARSFVAADGNAIAVMMKHGLATHPVTAETREAWRRLFAGSVELFFGRQFDSRCFHEAQGHLAELRAGAAPR